MGVMNRLEKCGTIVAI